MLVEEVIVHNQIQSSMEPDILKLSYDSCDGRYQKYYLPCFADNNERSIHMHFKNR